MTGCHGGGTLANAMAFQIFQNEPKFTIVETSKPENDAIQRLREGDVPNQIRHLHPAKFRVDSIPQAPTELEERVVKHMTGFTGRTHRVGELVPSRAKRSQFQILSPLTQRCQEQPSDSVTVDRQEPKKFFVLRRSAGIVQELHDDSS